MHFKKVICIFFSLNFIISSFLQNHTGPEYSATPYNHLDEAAIKFGAPYKLKLISSSLGTLAAAKDSYVTPWGLLFTCKEKLTLEQAEKLATEFTSKLLQTMYEDPSFKNYFEMFFKEYPYGNKMSLSDSSLAIRIDFWDEHVDRPLYPFIAEIRYADENFYYYYADPKTQALQPPAFIEPFCYSKRKKRP